jgi:hypothetical protein
MDPNFNAATRSGTYKWEGIGSLEIPPAVWIEVLEKFLKAVRPVKIKIKVKSAADSRKDLDAPEPKSPDCVDGPKFRRD